MSITTPPSKILLTSTTKISLNDRFAKLAKIKPASEVVATVAPVAAAAGPLVSPKVRASAQNQRLALQMAARPSVRAALQIKKKSIRQQLDVANRNRGAGPQRPRQQQQQPMAGRLSAPVARGNNRQINRNGRGFDASRLSFNNKKRGLSLAQRLSRPATMNNKIRRVGARNNQRANQSFGGRSNLNTSGRVNKRNSLGGGARLRRQGAGAPQRFNRPRNNQQGGQNRKPNNNNNNFRNNKMNNNKGAATGGKGKPQQANKTRENLDMDIDDFMRKSKSGLDKDLDSYMQQAAAANQAQD